MPLPWQARIIIEIGGSLEFLSASVKQACRRYADNPCIRFSRPYTLGHWTMKLGIINSAFYQAGVDTATGLKHIARIGFDCVDVHTEAVGISKQEIRLVANTCAKLRLP